MKQVRLVLGKIINITFNAYDLATMYASMMEAGYKMAKTNKTFNKASVKMGLLSMILEGIEKRDETPNEQMKQTMPMKRA